MPNSALFSKAHPVPKDRRGLLGPPGHKGPKGRRVSRGPSGHQDLLVLLAREVNPGCAILPHPVQQQAAKYLRVPAVPGTPCLSR